MSDLPPGGNAINPDALRSALDTAVRQALDTDEFLQAIDAAVRQALDTDEFLQAIEAAVRQALATDQFRQAFNGVVKQFLVNARREAREASVAAEIERAVAWPVKRAVAEAMGIDGLAKHGTPEPLRAIGIAIDAAVRNGIEQASNGREGA
jgi:3-methyladenine DNA glycosylase/8-oxoguanine DNA glycosylase